MITNSIEEQGFVGQDSCSVKVGDDDLLLRKGRRGFFIVFVLSVITLSFAYGLSIGFSRHSWSAQAKLAAVPYKGDLSDSSLFDKGMMAAGLELYSVGNDVEINGHLADVFSFNSVRDVKSLLGEQESLWKDRGFETAGTVTGKRGSVVAYDPVTNARYSAVAWKVQPQFRETVSEGYPVSGVISAIADESRVLTDGLDEAKSGLVPGVPMYPDGKSGAVFSSRDPGGRSYTGVYTLPASAGDVMDYYLSNLQVAGWTAVEQRAFQAGSKDAGHLVFEKGQEAIFLVMVESTDSSTALSVTRSPVRAGLVD